MIYVGGDGGLFARWYLIREAVIEDRTLRKHASQFVEWIRFTYRRTIEND